MRRMKDRDFDSAISIVRYVRVRKGLSQQGLCNACSDGLHPNDISKLERRDFRLQLWKVNAVAQFPYSGAISGSGRSEQKAAGKANEQILAEG